MEVPVQLGVTAGVEGGLECELVGMPGAFSGPSAEIFGELL